MGLPLMLRDSSQEILKAMFLHGTSPIAWTQCVGQRLFVLELTMQWIQVSTVKMLTKLCMVFIWRLLSWLRLLVQMEGLSFKTSGIGTAMIFSSWNPMSTQKEHSHKQPFHQRNIIQRLFSLEVLIDENMIH